MGVYHPSPLAEDACRSPPALAAELHSEQLPRPPHHNHDEGGSERYDPQEECACTGLADRIALAYAALKDAGSPLCVNPRELSHTLVLQGAQLYQAVEAAIASPGDSVQLQQAKDDIAERCSRLDKTEFPRQAPLGGWGAMLLLLYSLLAKWGPPTEPHYLELTSLQLRGQIEEITASLLFLDCHAEYTAGASSLLHQGEEMLASDLDMARTYLAGHLLQQGPQRSRIAGG